MKTSIIKTMILFSIILTGCVSLGPRPSVFDESLLTNTSTGQPQFTAETANIQDPNSPTSTILNIYVDIPCSELIFQKVDSTHQAKYDIELRTQHENGTVEYKIFEDITPTLTHAQLTDNTNKSFLYVIPYKGKPGDYILDIKVTDKIASRSSPLRIPATITPLSPKFDISDPIVIKNLDAINTTQSINQLAPRNPYTLSPWLDPVCTFEIYYPDKTDTSSMPIMVEYELKKNTKSILKKQFNISSTSTEKDIIGIQINLPDELQGGPYQLVLKTHILNPKTNEPELTSRTVVKLMRLSSPIPRSIRAMEKMVEPLIYFIPPPYKMMKNFKKAKTMRKKAQILDNFWQTYGHDVMESFYSRVEYADKHYGGWRTDMGSVFTKFGPPEAGVDKLSDWQWMPPIKYEVWHYTNYTAAHPFYFYLTDIEYNYKVFIFVDRFRINDFNFGRGGGGYYSKLSAHNFHELNSETRIH